MTVPGACRVRLRRLAADDLGAFQAYRGDAEVGRWQGWQATDDDDALDFLRACGDEPLLVPGAWCQVAIADAGDDALLGDIGVRLAPAGDAGEVADVAGNAGNAGNADAAEIGITLAAAAQGRGLALEALALAARWVFGCAAGVQRLMAVTDTRNTASLRLLHRAGFRRTACLAAVFRGQPCDEQHVVLHRPGRAPAVLRAATADDAEAVAGVLCAARHSAMPYAPLPYGDTAVGAWVAGTLLPGGGVTVAAVDGRVAGVLATSVRGSCGWIDQLYVHPAHAGAGIGTALLAHGLATLPRLLRLHAFQPNTAARAFYERHGFAALAFGDGSNTAERCPDVLYGRDAP